MKNQVLFSSKDKSKKLKCRLLQFLFGALRVKCSEKAYVSGKCSYFSNANGKLILSSNVI